jgi:mRNA interferase MazF
MNPRDRHLPRGAVVWAELDPVQGHEQRGRRPVLLLSDQRFNQKSGTVVAVPLTTQPQRLGPPFSIELPGEPLRWAKPTQVRVLSTERLGSLLEQRSPEEVEACLDAILMICGRSPR